MTEKEKVLWNIRAIAGAKKVSIEKLAELAGLDADHLKSVSSNRASMTATDLVKLSKVSGIHPYDIQTGKQ